MHLIGVDRIPRGLIWPAAQPQGWPCDVLLSDRVTENPPELAGDGDRVKQRSVQVARQDLAAGHHASGLSAALATGDRQKEPGEVHVATMPADSARR